MTTMTERIATAIVALLALAIAAYGLYLVIVGQEITVWPAVPIGAEPGDPTTRSVSALQGVIPMTASLLVLAGVAARRLLLAWIGSVVVLAFAGLFVFGVGGALLPVVGALFISLAFLSLSRRRPTSHVRTPQGPTRSSIGASGSPPR